MKMEANSAHGNSMNTTRHVTIIATANCSVGHMNHLARLGQQFLKLSCISLVVEGNHVRFLSLHLQVNHAVPGDETLPQVSIRDSCQQLSLRVENLKLAIRWLGVIEQVQMW
eukprot:CAMPEP_0204273360 /NCGR_PEP_ID=MMETSP0468-20130131/23153_1 /ASSEMBLY_ACC=CAM_ASM_000383 /TAXON_ID=2969 /ORGANISM="Oxyrrhis marina" /LENGTH=111 /DNA_ID=CAMNT_0051249359 /DNA_START=135 /DNA_END=467 /DNA_ORIENTATION=-